MSLDRLYFGSAVTSQGCRNSVAKGDCVITVWNHTWLSLHCYNRVVPLMGLTAWGWPHGVWVAQCFNWTSIGIVQYHCRCVCFHVSVHTKLDRKYAKQLHTWCVLVGWMLLWFPLSIDASMIIPCNIKLLNLAARVNYIMLVQADQKFAHWTHRWNSHNHCACSLGRLIQVGVLGCHT